MAKLSAIVGSLLLLLLLGARGAVICGEGKPNPRRPHRVSITDFGGIGDGLTMNTKAFQNAIFYLRSFADKGGAQLFVPAGAWLTGSFTLISHLTLSLDDGAIILGSTDPLDWTGQRSLIYGSDLTDVVISGQPRDGWDALTGARRVVPNGNGTVDGQGGRWWDRLQGGVAEFRHPHLVELVRSTGVIISDLTFRDPPNAAIHPVDCSQVLIKNVTILAPPGSPNTNGIASDSSSNVCIEDCNITAGGDLILLLKNSNATAASTNITIRRIDGSGGGIAIGGGISGAISTVHVDTLRLSAAHVGVAVRAPAGGHVENVLISGVAMADVAIAFAIVGGGGAAGPPVRGVTIKDVVGVRIARAGVVEGVEGGRIREICFAGVALLGTAAPPWRCRYSDGFSGGVSPELCPPLRKPIPVNCSAACYSLGDVDFCSFQGFSAG
ncbi:putative polygalacturonase [Wolffia australiana]